MNPLREVAKGRVHAAMPIHPAERCQGGRAQQDAEMAFPAAIVTRMPGVAVAVVDDFEPLGREGGGQSLGNLVRYGHFSALPLQSGG